ncbi:hypothetical protein DRE_03404 [Drechslerella stenobrocha 248]|uniref:Uncharacterized protein n=1 Tax=Drechslerella stenobrocha 248 TaxID=1043628 RepID=W7IE43_9PEZI|nr:hypothetical protein DRE_03404 [Drechslerella stenobrocha 248]
MRKIKHQKPSPASFDGHPATPHSTPRRRNQPEKRRRPAPATFHSLRSPNTLLRIRPNVPRMSIQCPRPEPEPPACLLLLPFLLPPRTRVFLRELLKKNAIARKTHWLSLTAVTRSVSSKAAPCPRPACSRRLLQRDARPHLGVKSAYAPPRRTVVRHFSDIDVTGRENPLPSPSEEPIVEPSEAPKPNAFSALEERVNRGHKAQLISYTSRQELRRQILVEEDDAEIERERQEVSKLENLIKQELDKAAENWGETDPEATGHKQFWNLLRERPPAEVANKRTPVLPNVPPPGSPGPPAPGTHSTVRDQSRADSSSWSSKADSITFRTARLEEFVLLAPSFSSNEDKEEYYALYTEKFLPPHLQLENTQPTPPLRIKPQTDFSPGNVDMPYPSVLSVSGAADWGPRVGKNGGPPPSEQLLHDLEVEWDTRWTPKAYLRLLYTLEIAREDGIDVLSSMLLKRRQREVVWIAKRIIDQRPDIETPNVNVWLQTSAAAEQEDPKVPHMSNDIEQGMTFYRRPELNDINRRRRGVGVLLSSLTSMLISGWQTDQILTKTIFNALTMIDTPSVLDHEEAPTAGQLFDSAFSQILQSPAEEPGVSEEMTPQEIFSAVAQLIAYLHIENHVPPIVYSSKHPRLQAMRSEIMRIIASEVEAAYGMELGVSMPRPDDSSARIDWSLWLELVNCIAAERGLGVSATWLLLRGADCISWDPPPSALSEPSESTEHAAVGRGRRERKLVLPSYLISQAKTTLMFNAALDAWPPETPGRMIRLLKDVAHVVGPYDMDFARELLDHCEVNMHASYAEDITKLPIQGKWDLDVYYSILAGTCFRRDLTQTIRVWGEIESILQGESPILEVRRPHSRDLRAVEFAPDTTFEHPWYILAIMIRHFRDRQRFDLIRYLVRTAIREGRLEKDPGFINLMLQHAGDTRDHALARFLLGRLEPPLARSTMTSVINLHLRFGQQAEAQAMLDFMKRNGIATDPVDLGIIARNTFKQSHAEGYALMDKAAARVKAIQAAEPVVPKTKTWSEGISVPVVQPRKADPIGPNAWFEVLLAALRDGSKDRATQALNALGIDLDDEHAASKMGIKIFNLLLASVCRREGSMQGMRMFKIYCVPDRDLLKQLDMSLKSHRSGDRRLDRGTERDGGRNKVGVGVRTPVYGQRVDKILRSQRQPDARREEEERRSGVIVPDVVTMRTIVHQAMREKRDFFITRRILERLPMQPSQERWMQRNAYFETNWEEVLDWAKAYWEMMDYGKDEWWALTAEKIIGPRTPRFKRPEDRVYNFGVGEDGGAGIGSLGADDINPASAPDVVQGMEEEEVKVEEEKEEEEEEALDDGLGEEEEEQEHEAVGEEDDDEDYPVEEEGAADQQANVAKDDAPLEGGNGGAAGDETLASGEEDSGEEEFREERGKEGSIKTPGKQGSL